MSALEQSEISFSDFDSPTFVMQMSKVDFQETQKRSFSVLLKLVLKQSKSKVYVTLD